MEIVLVDSLNFSELNPSKCNWAATLVRDEKTHERKWALVIVPHK